MIIEYFINTLFFKQISSGSDRKKMYYRPKYFTVDTVIVFLCDDEILVKKPKEVYHHPDGT